MTVIPCERDSILRAQIERFVETLKTEAHRLGDHGLSEKDFYESPILRGAIEVMRGEYSAKLGPKREFVQHILNHLEDGGHIAGWERDEGRARHDYTVRLNSARVAVIDLKGCLDGNNTTISERPAGADEFVVWSVCTNVGADPELNAWSGVHTRLGAEMIARGQRVDGVIIWDWVSGCAGRPCPKLGADPMARRTAVGPFSLPPPCIYVFPAQIPSQDAPIAEAQALETVELLTAFNTAFGGRPQEVNFVDFEVAQRDGGTRRRTIVRRDGVQQRASRMTPIRRA
ncbi:hypothetical protein [Phenylobacterium sp.]|uniref:hypothetical protein n=1 Tax=Phenylobacterium sp. TaxID=1871053 RepID=UPI003BAAD6FC